jgi:hypothetical protein
LLPDLLEQLLFFNHTPPMLDQEDQHVEGSRLYRPRLASLEHTNIVTLDTHVVENIGGWTAFAR